MNINSCEHPLRIFNKYTQEWQYVPCGKCNTCKRKKAAQWIERLNVERKCWKYCLFFTLTYADKSLPVLSKMGDDYLVDLSHKHQRPNDDCLNIDLTQWFVDSHLTKEEIYNVRHFQSLNENIPYLSVYDLQCFFKRLRKNLKNLIKSKYETYTEKDYFVRYYAVGEYGETTYRPHYHGQLFFSSEKEAACIEQAIYKSWTFGIVDSSYVAESNAAYLAAYLNCFTGLPKIYEHKDLRPFAIFSRQPPIGTLYFNEDEVQKMFLTANPRHVVDYFKSAQLSYAPIWRTFIDRLFPKISGFDKITHFDRVALYRASQYFEDFYEWHPHCDVMTFSRFMYSRYKNKQFDRYYLHVYDRYLEYLLQDRPNTDYISMIKRWYFVSHRVCTQAAAFDVSLDDYVKQIELYYDNVLKTNIKDLYVYEDDYAKRFGATSLVGIDKLWLESIIDVMPGDLTYQECLQLQSFGIDLEKWCSDDDSVRLRYQSELLPENSRDYTNVMLDSMVWSKKHTKTKVKNDYLLAHPEQLYKYKDFLPYDF